MFYLGEVMNKVRMDQSLNLDIGIMILEQPNFAVRALSMLYTRVLSNVSIATDSPCHLSRSVQMKRNIMDVTLKAFHPPRAEECLT